MYLQKVSKTKFHIADLGRNEVLLNGVMTNYVSDTILIPLRATEKFAMKNNDPLLQNPDVQQELRISTYDVPYIPSNLL